MKGRAVYIKTFGCQMNEHDSERMLGILGTKGFIEVDEPKKADIVIFNTCAIRHKAEQKFFSSLGRVKHLKKKNPQLKIIVAGCSAQLQGEKLLNKLPYIDYIIGPDNLHVIENIIENQVSHRIFTDENPEVANINLPVKRKDCVKAWVNIIYGCNNYCTYCVVPYTRGKERSRPVDDIIKEISLLAEQGYKEVTLLGQNVNSYKDGNTNFPLLLEKVEKIEGIKRIRFITSHPKDLSKELVDVMKDYKKICEHIHLPLQAGSNKILKLMNRKYTYEEYFEKICWLREAIPDIAITSDIIVGFPQEQHEDFEKTINALKEIRFDGIFAFKFSPRLGTAAAKLDGHISEEVKAARLIEVLKLQDEITERKNKRLEGKIQEVLVEGKDEEGFTTGKTRTNKVVKIYSDIKAGEIVNVKIAKTHRHSLEGDIIST
ncbi:MULTISPECIES: tRNA (N6-isopentenyl adenosine(37)-C2)-methylthiotransferase MiaB [Thermodesulfovibrio]|uniref:tRNA-2-methylthio-N(6)-dimethylallyladenosine synthase n=1 Tax=Thermodesulfovibrio yellowstonii (strain ATCC 51303 / DSM 11347 / YP87) TaxID=289376 RepID=MIAB_THEYD|nr:MULTISPECIES: tRNA (N6-isopentenyl adenosine(37)-C2)-methylthiotransferase MiaB [Thermodesulfovibrio]B5YKW2.1 RecName: Full=tRNA-2-methylthio-N(6)-dimethylallyladenosine synthase; AltName: Full=(Dimethylallyl)adenosine tRNA methylthiotransferase MiaB; AltName: Full=tRNA-i(6)A37 methylthiotransferase [Thermodesulfovibrio yellowstonii DSM 11347]ACI21164.1 tRNA-I(6)A37 thiotransferase enzyme MiaB [Thermodesulfovibrio yellowstonii DSM 11347]MBC7190478.1 tRNA (N6-isopentenyl adenosine(37)-C2)-meth